MTTVDGNSAAGRKDENLVVVSEGKPLSFLRFFLTVKGPPQIFLMIFIHAVALGSSTSVVQNIMTDRYARLWYSFDGKQSCGAYEVDGRPEECDLGYEDAKTATEMTQLMTSLLTFVMSSLVGSMSDSRGRKYILSLGALLSTIAPLVLVLMNFYESLDPFWYFFGKCMSGFVNIIAITTSSMSDVVPPAWRASFFGLILAGTSLGFTLSPLIATRLDERGISVFSMVFSIIVFLLAFFHVPETLPEERSDKVLRMRLKVYESGPAHYGFCGRFCHNMFRPFRELSILNRNKLFSQLTFLTSISSILLAVDQNLFLSYVEEMGFKDRDVSNLYLILCVVGILVQGFLLKPLNDFLGERLLLAVAFLAGVVQNLLYGFATSKVYIVVGMSLVPSLVIALPTISAIKSNNVDELEQGRVQGALYSISSLSYAVGPILMTYVYSVTKDFRYPAAGTFWLLGSFLYFTGCLVVRSLPKEQTNSKFIAHETEQVDNSEKI